MQNGKDRGKGTDGSWLRSTFGFAPWQEVALPSPCGAPGERAGRRRLQWAAARGDAAVSPANTGRVIRLPRSPPRRQVALSSACRGWGWRRGRGSAQPACVRSACRHVLLPAKVRHGPLRCVRGGGAAPSAARNPVLRNMSGEKPRVGGRLAVMFLGGGTVVGRALLRATPAARGLAGVSSTPDALHRRSGPPRPPPSVPTRHDTC